MVFYSRGSPPAPSQPARAAVRPPFFFHRNGTKLPRQNPLTCRVHLCGVIHLYDHSFLAPGRKILQFWRIQNFGQNLCLKRTNRRAHCIMDKNHTEKKARFCIFRCKMRGILYGPQVIFFWRRLQNLAFYNPPFPPLNSMDRKTKSGKHRLAFPADRKQSRFRSLRWHYPNQV